MKEISDRKPNPWYPDADINYSGPQDGVYWQSHDCHGWEKSLGRELAKGMLAAGPYLLPLEIWNALEGGRLDHETYPPPVQPFNRIYPDEKSAILALSAAILKVARGRQKLAHQAQ